LDLEHWEDVRHYPRYGFSGIDDSEMPAHVDQIARLLRRNVLAALGTSQRVYLPLTAGRDSRILLASVRAQRQQLDYVTFDRQRLGGRERKGNRVDLQVSAEIARDLRLRRLVIPVSPSPPSGTELRYLRRIGFAGGAGKSRDYLWSLERHLDPAGAWLTGYGGGTGKPFCWRSRTETTTRSRPRSC
jgi:hypothetical protein